MIDDNDDLSQQPDQSESEAETLDDLYGDFQAPQQTPPVQSTQQQQEPQPQQVVQPSITKTPDPVTEPEAFAQSQTFLSQELSALRSQFTEVTQQLSQERDNVASKTEERDFHNLADEIAKSSGLDTDIAEAGLLHKFVKDSTFKHIWNNRNTNPQAMKKVKTILTNEMKTKYAMKTDPQIAENQRALEEANKGASSSTKSDESIEDRVAKMDNREFANFEREMINKG